MFRVCEETGPHLRGQQAEAASGLAGSRRKKATARGVEVYALPGRVDHPMARGCHRLLREGAALIEAPEELVIELGLAERCAGTAANPLEPEVCEANGLAHSLLRALVGETLSLDELIARVGAPPSETLSQLAELELSGFVARSPGGLYRRCLARPP